MSAISLESTSSDSFDISSQTDLEESKKDANEYKIKQTLILTFLTYGATSGVFYAIGNEAPLLNAFIPTTAYFISTLEAPKVQNLATRIKNSISRCFCTSKNINRADNLV